MRIPKKRVVRVLAWGLGAIAILGLLVVGATNLLLNGATLRSVLNEDPEKTFVTWKTAFSRWPGSVVLTGQPGVSMLNLRVTNNKFTTLIPAAQEMQAPPFDTNIGELHNKIVTEGVAA